ncbi:hypothetical protein MNBD_GAMMA07-887 [hydrothermal vent metagenome]|uniref:DUF4124 domain-containing protein n=1 Tax=hydrothermal vent metagenome TaxID=652676 RepID=A0A3B0WZL6_9ZZZZ
MKFFLKLLLKAGFTLGVMFFGYKYLLTGNMGSLSIPGLSGVTESAQKGVTGLGNAVLDKDVTVYQWVDDKGVTHFGGTPPTGQGEYTTKSIQANTNVLNALKKQEQAEEKKTKGSRVSRLGNLYSPEGIKNLMDDTKQTSEKMSEQMAQQDKMLKDLMGEMGTKK